MTRTPPSSRARSTKRPRWLLASAGAASVVLLAGCSSSSHVSHSAGSAGAPSASTTASYGPAATGPHNAADITFTSDMIPHHQQAVEMAQMALARTTDAQVQALAAKIKAAQAPEIAQMGGWLIGWGKSVPTGTTTHHSMSGMTGGMATSDGMMSDAEMSALDAASGTAFAKLWLTGMIKHHQGAVAMAKTEQMDGTSSEAKALAGRIIASQSVEISTMTHLLATLG